MAVKDKRLLQQLTTMENSVTVALQILHFIFYLSQYSQMISRTEMKWQAILDPERDGVFIVHWKGDTDRRSHSTQNFLNNYKLFILTIIYEICTTI
jgi:hypothetical protein